MAILPEAGAVTVAANFRLMYDKRSEVQTNNAFISGLRRAEKDALAISTKADADLVKEHEQLVQRLKKLRDQADTDLKNSAEQTQNFLVNKRREAVAGLMRSMHPKAYHKGRKMEDLMGMGSSSQFKQALSRIEGHVDDFHRRMASKGLMAGEASFEEEFVEMEGPARTAIMKEYGRFVDEIDTKEIGDKTVLRQLYRDLESANNERTIALSIFNKIRKSADSEEIASERQKRQLMKENLQQRLQAISLLRQHQQSVQALSQSIGMGLRTALMQSGIALMTLGFRLNQVIESFKEFERELMNAQSIFQTTQDTLFGLSDQVAMFGTQYGIEINQAAEGLYQLASAGLTAAESQEVLNNTLKLSMAVQGDHNTIAKLTTQVIFGFGLQMSDSAFLTDKFAHAINKSLIEYQDLASAVKFAMPFFITTGQNIDQLLGALQVLTNRALEAGIAGRGLRQALAEFAQHADDNAAAFRKMGVEILDTEGNMLLLTEIAANFQNAMGGMANDTELMTTLLQDLNVRGATAFVHLVQNADEFKGAVTDLQNAAGSATEMADIQQQSLANTIQRVKNALMAPFLLSDEIGKAQGTINEFAATLHTMVADFEAFFIKTLPDGTSKLTDLGEALRDFVINTLKELSVLLKNVLMGIKNMAGEGQGLISVMNVLLVPIKAFASIMKFMPESLLSTVIMFKMLNQLMPINIVYQIAETQAMFKLAGVNDTLAASMRNTALAMMGMQAAMFIGLSLLNAMGESGQQLIPIFMALAGAIYTVALAKSLMTDPNAWNATYTIAALIAGGVAFGSMGLLMANATKPMSDFKYTEVSPTYDMGCRIPYADTGGSGFGNRHFPVMVEPGESVISKTMNMAQGNSSGITINIGGDVYDGDNFAEKISQALPNALRNVDDGGGL